MFSCSALNPPDKVRVSGAFDESCGLSFSEEALSAINRSELSVAITKQGGQAVISNLSVCIAAVSGYLNIFVGADGADIVFNPMSSGSYELRLWRSSKVSIGRATTSNGVRIVCDNLAFICGEDCMFSDEILIQSADQHGIVDTETGSIVNNIYRTIILGDHVWLGRRSILTASANVGDGSIIGAGAIVTGSVPAMAIAVGCPARVIKSNRTWTRNPVALDQYSRRYSKDNV
ncbi:transferase hexapeptide (six repeat-containing protein) [Hydrocarboniphaga daqingensis]|uniref:Transferase hexapeptide (Six repeat-containing protein) n=1 Tax=Hydrocarboniphaga daqingensis TaxID=490188 RepID=A0A1M5N7G0_9GAMM|nr:transferase hexapeptide (six repeat-containing protein) [Hydrocarboniphaga daqingensis]